MQLYQALYALKGIQQKFYTTNAVVNAKPHGTHLYRMKVVVKCCTFYSVRVLHHKTSVTNYVVLHEPFLHWTDSTVLLYYIYRAVLIAKSIRGLGLFPQGVVRLGAYTALPGGVRTSSLPSTHTASSRRGSKTRPSDGMELMYGRPNVLLPSAGGTLPSVGSPLMVGKIAYRSR